MPRRNRRGRAGGAPQPRRLASDDEGEPSVNGEAGSIGDGEARGSASPSAAKGGKGKKGSGKGRGVQLRRTRSWLMKIGGIALLPCEEALAEDLEQYQSCRSNSDEAGMDALHAKMLKAHPFVTVKSQEVPSEALPAGVSCQVENFRMNVRQFQNWLRTPDGIPFAEKGKGYDDGCYLTSAFLRNFMPRGFTIFKFKGAAGETCQVILRGFLKFTGLTATDEDEESGATGEVDAFMFRGRARSDASRFVVTTKSNGENGKYMMRRVLGEWYCFAGSKNTGKTWLIGKDVSKLYPVVKGAEDFSDIGAKIVKQAHDIISGLDKERSTAFLEEIDRDCLTIMVESNDPDHEHIFPIDRLHLEHVAILDRHGYPVPQRAAYDLFAKYGLESVSCDVYDDMAKLETVMVQIRGATDNEGAVVYLEQEDGTPVGLVKVKSDHYVRARRTREVVRGSLVDRVSKGGEVAEALKLTQRRLKTGMEQLTHVAGCEEHHEAWAQVAIAFAEDWAASFEKADQERQQELVKEFHNSYGTLYKKFYDNQQSQATSGEGTCTAEAAASA